MQLSLHKLSAILGIQLFELTVGCGVDPEQLKHLDEEDGLEPAPTLDTDLVATHKVTSLLKLDEALKGLKAKYQLHGCTGSLDASFGAEGVEISESALNCRVFISQLTLGTEVFETSDKQADWHSGSTIRFHSKSKVMGNLEVSVEHQLSSDPKAEKQVRFSVRRGDAAAATGSRTLLAEGVNGSEAPAFRIRKTEYSGMTATGAGQFVFHMDCLKKIQNSGTDPSCSNMGLSEIRYQLVADRYNSSLSFADAEAIFSENPGQSVNSTADFEAYQPELKQMGGFSTKKGEATLQGPDRMHDNPQMLLILQGPGPSYQYFNVDVVFKGH